MAKILNLKNTSIIILSMMISLVLLSCCSNTTSEKQVKNEIFEILNKQQACWNEGSLECFMDFYWKSDSLRFVVKRGIKYGWEPVLKNYKATYPTKEAMGTLKFDHLQIDILSKDKAMVTGRWMLEREPQEELSGYFTLIFEKAGEKWRIIYDHTS